MSKSKIVPIRMSLEEKRYAKALSLRLGGCRLKDSGSIAYTFKFLLHREAKRENIPIGNVYTTYNN
jgi:hypothetical protein